MTDMIDRDAVMAAVESAASSDGTIIAPVLLRLIAEIPAVKVGVKPQEAIGRIAAILAEDDPFIGVGPSAIAKAGRILAALEPVTQPAPDADQWVILRCDDGSTTRIDWVTGGGDPEGEFSRLGLVREWEDGRAEYRTYSAHGPWDSEPRQMPDTKTAPDPAAIREAALREALEALRGAGSFGHTAVEKHAALEQYCLDRDAILALLTEKPHDRA